LDTLKGAAAPGDEAAKRVSPPGEIFGIFLKLGCTSFGGPVAHIGYFRDEFVKRRGWFSESAFADIVALCQFMPGPASSQTGMAIGLIRGGYAGMFAAWIAFTLPSALLMIAFALGLDAMGGAADAGWIRGLKLVAVAVVAQAVLGMAGHLCPDRPRASLAILATIVLLVVQHPAAQSMAPRCRAPGTSPKLTLTPSAPSASRSLMVMRPEPRTVLPARSARPVMGALQKTTCGG